MVCTINNHEILLEVLTGEQLLSMLSSNFPEITEVLKSSEIMTETLQFYKARYRFGDDIITNQKIYFALKEGKKISIDDASFPTAIAKDIMGDDPLNNPLGLIISHGAEVYLYKDSATHTDSILYPGDFIGVPRALDPGNLSRSSILEYNICAGARSVFMLQKISNKQMYRNIAKNTHIDVNCPVSFEDHWKTFADIARGSKNEWMFDIIYFPRRFIDLMHDTKYHRIYVYLNKLYSKSYGIKHSTFNLWQVLYFMGIEKNYLSAKYNPLYINIVKSLFMIAAKSAIAFQPSSTEIVLPLKDIQSFYENEYGLENPVIMEPTYFDYTLPSQQALYLSLNFQESMRHIIDKSSKKTKISVLEDLKYLLDKYLSNLEDEKIFKNQALRDLIKHTKFSYFHNSIDIKLSPHVAMARVILEKDPRFLTDKLDEESIDYLASAHFFTGGIVINRKA